MTDNFKKSAIASAIIGVLGLTLVSGTAQAQAADDFDVSVTTNAAAGIACGQNLSFGRAYVAASNSVAIITLTSGGALSSNHASVAVTGGSVGQCTLSGLQGADTATILLSGGGGTPTTGGLTGVELSDGASNTLTAALQIGTTGSTESGGRSGLENGVIPIFGTITIPAGHLDFGTYTATITATAALD